MYAKLKLTLAIPSAVYVHMLKFKPCVSEGKEKEGACQGCLQTQAAPGLRS